MASISTTNSDTRKNLEQLLPEDFGDVSEQQRINEVTSVNLQREMCIKKRVFNRFFILIADSVLLC